MQCQLAGAGRPARVVLLHSRPEGDDFLALVTSSQVCIVNSHDTKLQLLLGHDWVGYSLFVCFVFDSDLTTVFFLSGFFGAKPYDFSAPFFGMGSTGSC